MRVQEAEIAARARSRAKAAAQAEFSDGKQFDLDVKRVTPVQLDRLVKAGIAERFDAEGQHAYVVTVADLGIKLVFTKKMKEAGKPYYTVPGDYEPSYYKEQDKKGISLPPWTGYYALVGVGTSSSNSETLADVKGGLDNARMEKIQDTLSVAEFTLAIWPLGSAIDNLEEGNYGSAAAHAVGDAAGVGIFSKSAKIVKASIAVEGGLIAYNVSQYADGKISGSALVGDVILRVVLGGAGGLRLRALGKTPTGALFPLVTKRATPEIESSADAWTSIDRLRSHSKNLPPLGDTIPVPRDGLGTVALVEVRGKIYYGVNSSELSEASKNLGRDIFEMMKGEGLWDGLEKMPKWYGDGAAQVLTHAEAHALILK